MSEKTENLRRLSQLANLVLDAQLAKLASATRHRDVVQAQISKLDEEFKLFAGQRARKNLHDTHDFQGNEKKWQDWRRTVRANLNSRLANAEAARESERKVTKQAFGRAQAVEELLSISRD